MKKSYIYKSGYCKLDNGNEIYVECFGNRKAEPIIFLHGGPGSGFTEAHKKLFDPKRDNVIFYDQRGAGKSRPYCVLENNNTQNLVEDMLSVFQYAGIQRAYVVGVSWGVALGLLFAVKYPEKVKGFLLASVFLGTRKEIAHFIDGSVADSYPKIWERFIGAVPEKSRRNIVEYYLDQMTSGSEIERNKMARSWALYDLSLSFGEDNLEKVEKILDNFSYRSLAVLTAFYIKNNFFISDCYIEKNISRISKIPAIIIHGKNDAVVNQKIAKKLHSMFENSKLFLVETSHGSNKMGEVISEKVPCLY